MKKLAFLVLSVIAVSCAKELGNQENPGNVSGNCLTASLEDGTSTRTLLQNGRNVIWNGDETITAFTSDGTAYNSTSITKLSDEKAEFTFDTTVSELEYGAYPAGAATYDSGSTLNVTIPAEQTACAGGFSSGANTSVGKVNSGKISFKNVGALLKVTLNCGAQEISSLKLTLTQDDGNACCGTGKATIGQDGSVSTTAPSCGSIKNSSITLSGTFVNGESYYFVVYPQTYSRLQLDLTNASGKTITQINPNKIAVDRNDIIEIFKKDVSDFSTSYYDLYDRVSDSGQYFVPYSSKVPTQHFTIVDAEDRGDRNELRTDSYAPDDKNNMGVYKYGVQAHLLAQSVAGLINAAYDEGKATAVAWLKTNQLVAYDNAKALCGNELGQQNASELAINTCYGELNMREITGSKYILTDVASNPESAIVAAVAAHVYKAIIVDVQDEAAFQSVGYSCIYDARSKTTADSWNEFKDKCSKKAVVLMPVRTGELREYAIRNRLFVINLNKQYASGKAENLELFKTVLKSLDPGAVVFGWEQGMYEDVFMTPISHYGKTIIPSDWSCNHSLTSYNYPARQSNLLAKVICPKDIDYSSGTKFVSFMLSDGDNYQWLMQDDFDNRYYHLTHSKTLKMSFGMSVSSLGQLAPERLSYLFNHQYDCGTVLETFGCGYFYADLYGDNTGRKAECLKELAQRVAANMRQHRVKVLHLIGKSWNTDAAKQAYQAFIDANDQLEGIVAIQYDPYTAGHGNILWFTNTQGYDIPVVSIKYALWANNTSEENGTGTETEVGNWIRENNSKFNPVIIHAWSTFKDNSVSSDAAYWTYDTIGANNCTLVNMQEMIWRIRYDHSPEQTKRFIDTYCN